MSYRQFAYKNRRRKNMIILIAGASHTGKTKLSQSLMEEYGYPYFSIDHLKMGLIRSGNTLLTPEDDDELTPYLWNIVKEMIKTAIENNQNLIVEGCYIPFDWAKDFEGNYLKQIEYNCLIMTREYIENHFDDIKRYANVIERRGDDLDCDKDNLIKDNLYNLEMCKKHDCRYVLTNDNYEFDLPNL